MAGQGRTTNRAGRPGNPRRTASWMISSPDLVCRNALRAMVQFPAGLIGTHNDDVRGTDSAHENCLASRAYRHPRKLLLDPDQASSRPDHSLSKDQMPAERLAAETGSHFSCLWPLTIRSSSTFATVEPIEIRALRPDDRTGMLAAIGRTSSHSLRRRFFAPKKGFSEQELAFFLNIDFEQPRRACRANR